MRNFICLYNLKYFYIEIRPELRRSILHFYVLFLRPKCSFRGSFEDDTDFIKVLFDAFALVSVVEPWKVFVRGRWMERIQFLVHGIIHRTFGYPVIRFVFHLMCW